MGLVYGIVCGGASTSLCIFFQFVIVSFFGLYPVVSTQKLVPYFAISIIGSES